MNRAWICTRNRKTFLKRCRVYLELMNCKLVQWEPLLYNFGFPELCFFFNSTFIFQSIENDFYYKKQHRSLCLLGFLSTDRIASAITLSKFCCFNAEHSTYLSAWICLAILRQSFVGITLSLSSSRRSPFVPAKNQLKKITFKLAENVQLLFMQFLLLEIMSYQLIWSVLLGSDDVPLGTICWRYFQTNTLR